MPRLDDLAGVCYRWLPDGWTNDWLKWNVGLVSERATEYEVAELPYVSNEDIASWTGKLLKEPKPEEAVDARRFKVGDVLFNKLRPYLAKVYRAEFDGLSSGELLCLRPNKAVSPRYLFYYVSSYQLIERVNAATFGTKMPRADWDIVGHQPLAMPDRDMQERIADFLDERTTRIDGLIAKKTRLLELLAEQRQALITRAVTRGLDPSAPMKPSGIDWLGDIPAHWDVRRLKFIALVRISNVDKIVSDEETPICLCNYTDVYYNDVITSDLPFMQGSATIAEIERFKLRHDQVIITKDSESWDDIGIPAYVPHDLSGVVCGYHLAVTTPSNEHLSGRYLSWLCRSESLNGQFKIAANGVTRFALGLYGIKNAEVFTPPLAVQEHIADFLDKKTAQIDHTVTKVQASIGLLREYRSALITAAVTGQMKIERTVSKTAVSAIDTARVRVVVGAEIIHRHRGNAWAGRTKLQKLLYLAEAHADIHELRGDYSREAAGPMAGSLLDAVEAGMADAGFYQVRKHQSGAFDYPPLSNAGQHIADLEAALGERVAQLRRVIDLLRDCNTKKVEGVATLYAVWNEALMDGHDWTNAEIITAVLTDWHIKKPRKFSRGDLITLLDWMRSHHLTPRGVGPRTRQPGLFP